MRVAVDYDTVIVTVGTKTVALKALIAESDRISSGGVNSTNFVRPSRAGLGNSQSKTERVATLTRPKGLSRKGCFGGFSSVCFRSQPTIGERDRKRVQSRLPLVIHRAWTVGYLLSVLEQSRGKEDSELSSR
ncbi:hypothetical protein H351_30535 (plasmid) [Rhodococcus erythropolis R138]|nr:hypothetical protein H351_30535 [Rhodococcus erythropolis R138]